MVCVRGQYFRPRKRLRKPPDGMSQERFEDYLVVAESEELTEAFRARLVTASQKQMGEAWHKGVVPPLPTFDNLIAYWGRTAQRPSVPRNPPVPQQVEHLEQGSSIPRRFCDLDCIDAAIARHVAHPSLYDQKAAA